MTVLSLEYSKHAFQAQVFYYAQSPKGVFSFSCRCGDWHPAMSEFISRGQQWFSVHKAWIDEGKIICGQDDEWR